MCAVIEGVEYILCHFQYCLVGRHDNGEPESWQAERHSRAPGELMSGQDVPKYQAAIQEGDSKSDP